MRCSWPVFKVHGNCFLPGLNLPVYLDYVSKFVFEVLLSGMCEVYIDKNMVHNLIKLKYFYRERYYTRSSIGVSIRATLLGVEKPVVNHRRQRH